jgi:hypothetical protein
MPRLPSELNIGAKFNDSFGKPEEWPKVRFELRYNPFDKLNNQEQKAVSLPLETYGAGWEAPALHLRIGPIG